MVVMAAPAPIDPRGPRFNQAVLAVALLGGFLVDWRPVVPLFALVLLAGAALTLGGCVVAPAPGYYARPYGYGPPGHYYRPRPYYRPYW